MTYSSSNSYYCQLNLFRNGAGLNSMAEGNSYGRTGGSDSDSNSAVLTLSSGDTVWIRTGSCDYLIERPYSSFSGFKI